ISFSIGFRMVTVIDNKTAVLLHVQCPYDAALNRGTSFCDLPFRDFGANGKSRTLRNVKNRGASSIGFSERWDGSGPGIELADFWLTGIIIGECHGMLNAPARHLTAPYNPRQLTDSGAP